jgi:hypothetical protein
MLNESFVFWFSSAAHEVKSAIIPSSEILTDGTSVSERLN